MAGATSTGSRRAVAVIAALVAGAGQWPGLTLAAGMAVVFGVGDAAAAAALNCPEGTPHMTRPIPAPWRRRGARRASAAVAAGLVLALVSGHVTPVHAADAVPLPKSEMADILFGAAVRLKDSGPAYHRSVVLTAEMLDWRAVNPAADEAAVTAHVTAVEQKLNSGITAADLTLPPTELLGRQLKALYATPGAVITGTQTTNLLNVVTARDLGPGVPSIDQRLSGAQQRYALDVAYSQAQHTLWLDLRKKAGPDDDRPLAATWKKKVGKPTTAEPDGVDPKWSFDDLKTVSQLKDLVDVTALSKAAEQGSEKFWTELRKQFQALQTKLNGEQSKLATAIEDLLTKAGVPGKPGERGPTKAQIAQAQKDQKERQGTIDGVKAGMDVLVWMAEKVDAGFAKHLAGFAETAYQIATAVNQLYTSIATLAVATGMGAATFGVVGAVIGAVIGLVQVFVTLFRNKDEKAKNAAQEQLLKAISAGFEQVERMMEQLYTSMNDRFDRVDASLAKIYRDMMGQFATVLELLYDVKGDLRKVHGDLLALESKVQMFSHQLISQVSDSNKTEFLTTADKYVDYEYQNNKPLPNYDTGGNDYVTGVSRFATAATSTARNSNFTWSDFASTDTDAAIGAHGPAGAVDYLARRAAGYGMSIPTTQTRVPNADLWAEAARAYTLTAVQNPGFAATESEARANRILDAGRQIRDTAAAFSEPVAPPAKGAWVATNPLYLELVKENNELRTAFLDSLSDLEKDVMAPGRQIRLWNTLSLPPPFATDGAAEKQYVDVDKLSTNPTDKAVNKLKAVPAQAGRCTDGDYRTKVPDNVTGRDLPRPLLLGLYADASWSYSLCWAGAHWSEPYTVTHEHMVGGGKFPPVKVYTFWRYRDLIADFKEWVTVPGHGKILGRSTTMKHRLRLCTWGWGTENKQDDCSDDAGNATKKMTELDLDETVSTTSDAEAGIAQARDLLTDRRAMYYSVVATKLRQNALPEAKALNSSMRRLQAYTAIGFPRALETDDQLRALLHGDHGLPHNMAGMPIIEAIYRQAAKSVTAGKSGTADQPLLDQASGGCHSSVIVLFTGDPVSNCLRNAGQARADELAYRYEVHSKALHRGEEVQTLPLVDEAIANLELVRTYVRTRGTGPTP